VALDDGDMALFFEIVELRLLEVTHAEPGEGGEWDIAVFHQDWDLIDQPQPSDVINFLPRLDL